MKWPSRQSERVVSGAARAMGWWIQYDVSAVFKWLASVSGSKQLNCFVKRRSMQRRNGRFGCCECYRMVNQF